MPSTHTAQNPSNRFGAEIKRLHELRGTPEQRNDYRFQTFKEGLKYRRRWKAMSPVEYLEYINSHPGLVCPCDQNGDEGVLSLDKWEPNSEAKNV